MAKGKSAKHTSCRTGTRVVIKTRDGQTFVDTFMEKKGGTIFLKDYGRINKNNLLGFKVYNG